MMDIKTMQDRMEYELEITVHSLNNSSEKDLNLYFAGRFHGVVAMITNASGVVNCTKIKTDTLLKIVDVKVSW